MFVRISATDWVEGGWDVEQSVVLAGRLKKLGIDLIDVSSGGLVPIARIPVAKGYQVPLAKKIRCEAGVMTGAVGLITEARQANEIVTGGDADLVLLARELLREPYWAQGRARARRRAVVAHLLWLRGQSRARWSTSAPQSDRQRAGLGLRQEQHPSADVGDDQAVDDDRGTEANRWASRWLPAARETT